MAASVQVEFSVPAEVREEGAYFVSGCPALDVYSQGETREEALDNLGEALQLFLESCYERGTLEQVLKRCGLRPDRRAGALAEGEQIVRVSLPLVAQAG